MANVICSLGTLPFQQLAEDFIDFNVLNFKGLLNLLCFQHIVDIVSVTTNCE